MNHTGLNMELCDYQFLNPIFRLDQIPMVSGIYSIGYNEEIIYIGQSSSVRHRLEEHMQYFVISRIPEVYPNIDVTSRDYRGVYAIYNFLNEKKLPPAAIRFGCTICPIEDLNKMEEHYIKEYKPRFNKAGNTEPYIPYNRTIELPGYRKSPGRMYPWNPELTSEQITYMVRKGLTDWDVRVGTPIETGWELDTKTFDPVAMRLKTKMLS